MSFPVVKSNLAIALSVADAGPTTSPVPPPVALNVVPDMDRPLPREISWKLPAPEAEPLPTRTEADELFCILANETALFAIVKAPVLAKVASLDIDTGA